jgi:hypothetical protein
MRADSVSATYLFPVRFFFVRPQPTARLEDFKEARRRCFEAAIDLAPSPLGARRFDTVLALLPTAARGDPVRPRDKGRLLVLVFSFAAVNFLVRVSREGGDASFPVRASCTKLATERFFGAAASLAAGRWLAAFFRLEGDSARFCAWVFSRLASGPRLSKAVVWGVKRYAALDVIAAPRRRTIGGAARFRRLPAVGVSTPITGAVLPGDTETLFLLRAPRRDCGGIWGAVGRVILSNMETPTLGFRRFISGLRERCV